MSRTLERSIARNLYGKFAAEWRRELRKSGLYGTPKAPKRPTFAHWYALHEKDQRSLEQSTPSDVMEFLEAADPWADPQAQESRNETGTDGDGAERGAMTIPMVGGDEE